MFGRIVAISGTTAIVGAIGDDDGGTESGSAYLYPPGASCTPRSGILGLNPADFSCAGAPVMGATWSTTVATTPSLGSSTLSTFVALGVGGATQGIPVFGHELLILPPFLSFAGSGAHDFPVPTDPALAGLSQSWQGGRLEQGSGFFLVLTNALDVVYGL
jgi:hypothetical protein